MKTSVLKLTLLLSLILSFGCSTNDSETEIAETSNVILMDNNKLSKQPQPVNTELIEVQYTDGTYYYTAAQKQAIRESYVNTIGLVGYETINPNKEIWHINIIAPCTICVERCGNCDKADAVDADDVIDGVEPIPHSGPSSPWN